MTSARCVRALYKIAEDRPVWETDPTYDGQPTDLERRQQGDVPATPTPYPTKAPSGLLDRFAHNVVGWLSPENARNDWWDSYSKNKNAWKYAALGLGGMAIGGTIGGLLNSGNNNGNGGGGNGFANALGWAIPLGLLAVGGKYAIDQISPHFQGVKGFIDDGRKTMSRLNDAISSANAQINSVGERLTEKINAVGSAAEQGVQEARNLVGQGKESLQDLNRRFAESQASLELSQRRFNRSMQRMPGIGKGSIVESEHNFFRDFWDRHLPQPLMPDGSPNPRYIKEVHGDPAYEKWLRDRVQEYRRYTK